MVCSWAQRGPHRTTENPLDPRRSVWHHYSLTSAHPFFSNPNPKPLGNFQPSPDSLCHFLHLDPFSRVTTSPVTIIFYDLDGTLIKTKSGAQYPRNREDWVWWNDIVPSHLKREWEEGKHIVVLSNQADDRPKIRNEWKAKLPLIVAKVRCIA